MLEVFGQLLFDAIVYGVIGGAGRYIYGDENQSGFSVLRLGFRLFVFLGAIFLGAIALDFFSSATWAFLIGIPWILCFATFLYYEKTRGSIALWVSGLIAGLVVAALALA